MSTTNNNTANYTVENLVAKYCDYVNEHCPKLFDDYSGKEFPDTDGSMEALMLAIYKRAAGEDANKYIANVFGDYVAHACEKDYSEALSEGEYMFLCNNFSEFMDVCLSQFKDYNPINSDFLSKQSRVELVQKYLTPENGATLYLANSSFDLAKYFPNCNYQGYFCDGEMDLLIAVGWMYFYSKGVQSNMFFPFFYEEEGYKMTVPNKGNIKYIIYGTQESTTYRDILALYEALSPNGKMLVFMDKSELQGKNDEYRELRNTLVNERSISSIISYNDSEKGRILLVIDKNRTDAVDIVSLSSNRQIAVSSSLLNSDILWPGYYLTTRPKEGIPLSHLVEVQSLRDDFDEFKQILGGKVKWEVSPNGERIVLPEWMLNLQIATQSDMSNKYQDANLCEKKLHLVSNPMVDNWRSSIRIVNKPCVLLSGGYGVLPKFVLGYYDKTDGRKYAKMAQQPCLFSKEGIDIRYLAALLLTPSVSEQILSICDEDYFFRSDFSLLLDWVIVPNHSDKERLVFLSEANYEGLISSKKEIEKSFEKKFGKMKADYINEVRMRKHDMRPHLRQLASSERLMLHYIDNINNLEEIKKAMKKQIASSHDALESISELVDHLSDEERFGEPERVNLNKFFEDLEINHNDNECFTLETYCEEAISQIRGESLAEIVEHAQAKGISLKQFVKQYNADTNALYVNIAPVDLNRLVNNIVENARRHGFTDKCRNDYYFSVNVKINNQRNMYQIDFCNNGNPLPVGMTKDRYGLKGEKAGANAGTGSGGYIVRSIVEHYGGDYDVFTKDGITTIRIYLPKSSVE